MITQLEIGFVIGLVEGEGYFKCAKIGQGTFYISVGMTDRDAIARLARIWKRPVLGPYRDRRANRKPTYVTYTCAQDAIGWAMTMYPMLCKRRRAQIRKWLKIWKKRRTVRVTRRYGLGVVCHPKRKHFGKGYCSSCYAKLYRKHGKDLPCAS